jgi:catechol 2,3-dioxygenase-like lactoylglutathione lyase family enzyme
MVEVNGMAHVVLTVSEFEKSRAFYCELSWAAEGL